MRLGIKTDDQFLVKLNEKMDKFRMFLLIKLKIGKEIFGRCNATRGKCKKTRNI